MTAAQPLDATELLSIGELAEATGISPDTLRVWERRYGRPEPVRLPSGHRRYGQKQVRWLRRVAEALALGHRPGEVVRAGEDALERMLAGGDEAADSAEVRELLGAVHDLGGTSLECALRGALEARSPERFLAEIVGPFLTALGRDWADGRLEVRHEHHASQVLEDILRSLRGSLVTATDGPVVLLCTLEGEGHGLGIQMASIVATLAGTRTSLLGTSTPNDEIRAAAVESRARAVLVSVSLATGGIDTDRQVAALREALPEDVLLVLGGRGARGVRRGPRGVTYVEDLGELEAVLRDLQ